MENYWKTKTYRWISQAAADGNDWYDPADEWLWQWEDGGMRAGDGSDHLSAKIEEMILHAQKQKGGKHAVL